LRRAPDALRVVVREHPDVEFLACAFAALPGREAAPSIEASKRFASSVNATALTPCNPKKNQETTMIRRASALLAAAAFATAFAAAPIAAQADQDARYIGGSFRADYDGRGHFPPGLGRVMGDPSVQLGPRPFFLVDGLEPGPLKDRLAMCKNGPFYRSDFSIAHRGAPLQLPEHTKEAAEAGARMGAGILECDVTFTKDGVLVCRHDECDLHTTTNIVATPLNAQCTVPWSGPPPAPAPRCCTSDITLAQFKTLKGKMDASNRNATTAEGFLGGTATWRTDLYTSRGTLMTHAEHIELVRKLGGKYTPELKFPNNPSRVVEIFGSQENYAQKMIDEYKAAGIPPSWVWPQSFNLDDVLYWIEKEPQFGKQAVYLDPSSYPNRLSLAQLKQLRQDGVRIFAPPIQQLLAVNSASQIVPSQYALDIKSAGLDIITWSFERVDLRRGAAGVGSYYAFDPTGAAVKTDSDMYKALDVLARDVKVIGIFSDWPATVTYYANCMGLK
jgi:glycerophosphoryl diester phosphodiesterase